MKVINKLSTYASWEVNNKKFKKLIPFKEHFTAVKLILSFKLIHFY